MFTAFIQFLQLLFDIQNPESRMLDNSNLRFLLISASRHYTAGQGILLWQDKKYSILATLLPLGRNIQHLEEIFNTWKKYPILGGNIQYLEEIFNTGNSLTTW